MGYPDKVARQYFPWQYAHVAEEMSGSYDEYFDELFNVDSDADTVPTHSNPDIWDKLAFKISKPRKHEVNFKNLPAPTLTIDDGNTGDRYFIYFLRDSIPLTVEPKKDKKDPRNCYQMVQHSLSVEHGLEPVNEIPAPDGVIVLSHAVLELPDENGEMQPDEIKWTATGLLQWQRQHGYTKNEFFQQAQSAGGSANTSKQQAQRAQRSMAGVTARQLKADYRAMMAEAIDALTPQDKSVRQSAIADALQVKLDTVRSLLTRADALTSDQRKEAVAYATSKGWDISPITEHNTAHTPTEPPKPIEEAPQPSTPVEPVKPAERHTEPVTAIPASAADLDLERDSIAAVVHSLSNYSDEEIVGWLKRSIPGFNHGALAIFRKRAWKIAEWDQVIEQATQNGYDWMRWYQYKSFPSSSVEDDKVLSWSDTDSEFADLLEVI